MLEEKRVFTLYMPKLRLHVTKIVSLLHVTSFYLQNIQFFWGSCCGESICNTYVDLQFNIVKLEELKHGMNHVSFCPVFKCIHLSKKSDSNKPRIVWRSP